MHRKYNEGKGFFKSMLIIELLVIVGVILIGTILFHYIENRSMLNSLYFVSVTMTTIGYGDIVPHTDMGKIVAIIYAFLGVPFFISLTGILLESRFNKRLKHYISRFHKELHDAEEELERVEHNVSRDIGNVMQETQKTENEVLETAKDIKKTKKKVDRIEQVLEEKILEEKKPRWKKIIK